jgi:hypothetical protein
MPRVGFEPKTSAGERPKTYALTARPLGPGIEASNCLKYSPLCSVALFSKKEGKENLCTSIIFGSDYLSIKWNLYLCLVYIPLDQLF